MQYFLQNGTIFAVILHILRFAVNFSGAESVRCAPAAGGRPGRAFGNVHKHKQYHSYVLTAVTNWLQATKQELCAFGTERTKLTVYFV